MAAGYPRFVVDRDRVTGGGISSGLDEALEVIALLRGDDAAKNVQLRSSITLNHGFSGEILSRREHPGDLMSLLTWSGNSQSYSG